jgi:hypothetical protein
MARARGSRLILASIAGTVRTRCLPAKHRGFTALGHPDVALRFLLAFVHRQFVTAHENPPLKRLDGLWYHTHRATMTLLASKQHTAGSTKRWTVNYDYWLDNAAGRRRQLARSASHHKSWVARWAFSWTAEKFLTMADTLKNIKHDTISFKCVAPWVEKSVKPLSADKEWGFGAQKFIEFTCGKPKNY